MSFAPAITRPTRKLIVWTDSIGAGANYDTVFASYAGARQKTSFFTEMCRLSDGVFPLTQGYAQGQGGDDTGQILARAGNWNTMTGIFGVVFDGYLNDSNHGLTLQQSKDNLRDCLSVIWATGALACWLDVLPAPYLMDGGAKQAARAELIAYVHSLIDARNAQFPDRRARDCWIPVTNDPASIWYWNTSIYTDDNTHPNVPGQPYLGQLALNAVSAAGWLA